MKEQILVYSVKSLQKTYRSQLLRMRHGGSVLSADFRTLVPDPITIVAFNPPLPVYAADGTTVVMLLRQGRSIMRMDADI